MALAISVYSAGEPYAAALYCSGKNPATLGFVSVLEFVAIESYLKAISSDYQGFIYRGEASPQTLNLPPQTLNLPPQSSS